MTDLRGVGAFGRFLSSMHFSPRVMSWVDTKLQPELLGHVTLCKCVTWQPLTPRTVSQSKQRYWYYSGACASGKPLCLCELPYYHAGHGADGCTLHSNILIFACGSEARQLRTSLHTAKRCQTPAGFEPVQISCLALPMSRFLVCLLKGTDLVCYWTARLWCHVQQSDKGFQIPHLEHGYC